MRRAALATCLLALLPCAGCFPVLTHGARVDPGPSWGFNGSYAALTRPATQRHSARLTLGMDAGAFVGLTAKPAKWHGGGLRLSGSANLSSAYVVDLYGQLPISPLGDHMGVGILYQPMFRKLVFPYVMTGWVTPAVGEVYATVGIADTRGMSKTDTQRHKLGVFSVGLQSGPAQRSSRSSLPASIYLMVFVGPQGDDSCEGWCVPLGGSTHLLLGSAFDFPPLRGRRPRGMPPGLPPD